MDWINKLKIIIYIIFVFLVFGCTNSTDKKIIHYIQNLECIDTCCIDLRNVLNVDYDIMYLFGEFTLDDEISSIIGIEYQENKVITDSKYRIILVKNNKIVYEDDFYQKNINFITITNERDAVNCSSLFYLVHYSPFYLVTKNYYTNSDKYQYNMEEINCNSYPRYYLRLNHGKYIMDEIPPKLTP